MVCPCCAPAECPPEGVPLVLPEDVFATVKVETKCLASELSAVEEFSATLGTAPTSPILFGRPFDPTHSFQAFLDAGTPDYLIKRAFVTLDCAEGKMRLRFLFATAWRPNADADCQIEDFAGVLFSDGYYACAPGMWCYSGFIFEEISSAGHSHVGGNYNHGGDPSQWEWISGKQWTQTVYQHWDYPNPTGAVEIKTTFTIDGIG